MRLASMLDGRRTIEAMVLTRMLLPGAEQRRGAARRPAVSDHSASAVFEDHGVVEILGEQLEHCVQRRTLEDERVERVIDLDRALQGDVRRADEHRVRPLGDGDKRHVLELDEHEFELCRFVDHLGRDLVEASPELNDETRDPCL